MEPITKVLQKIIYKDFPTTMQERAGTPLQKFPGN